VVAESAPNLDRLALAAAGGDKRALGELCRELQHPIYRLALRMLSSPEDAEDATQEVLVRIVTNLGTFEGRSRFMTWVYTVATRQLLRTRKRLVESSVRSADAFGAAIDAGLGPVPDDVEGQTEYEELCAEVRISCTYGMLLCLSREVRLAYILGDLMGMTDRDGAEVCEVTPAAFRKRLSRARKTMRRIIANRCGLVREENPCRCGGQIASGERLGVLERGNLKLATHPRRDGRMILADTTIEAAARQLDLAEAIAEVYKTDPEFVAPRRVYERLRRAAPDLLL
jgi:RNA polymerase sigma factor (sigma-70 family)